MKKQYIIGIGALLIGTAVGMCFTCSPKIAVVNVNQVVQAYPKLSLFQRENALKVGELSQWLDAAQKKIDAEKDKTKKAALIQQTQAVAVQRKAEIQKEYWHSFPYWFHLRWWAYALRHHWFKHMKRLGK